MQLADVTFDRHEHALVAHLVGEIDMSNAQSIGSAVLETTPNDVLGLILDLSRVQYLDSAGISVVFEMRSRLRARGQSLKLVVPHGSLVGDVLHLAGVEGQVDVVETVEEGVRAVGTGEATGPPAF